MSLPVLFSVILLSLTTTQIHLVRSEIFMDLDLGPGAGVQVIDVLPCHEEPGSVKRLDMDLLVLQENFTECDNTRQRETVSPSSLLSDNHRLIWGLYNACSTFNLLKFSVYNHIITSHETDLKCLKVDSFGRFLLPIKLTLSILP